MRHHDVQLRAPDFLGGGSSPVLLRRTDQRFVEGLFRDLSTEQGRALLSEDLELQTAADDAEVLYQPVHRAFHIVLVEAFCDAPGKPRVDPKKLMGAGVVIRRRLPTTTSARLAEAARRARRKDPKATLAPAARYGSPERWIRRGDRVEGWDALQGSEATEDPTANMRLPPSSGNPTIDAVLNTRRQIAEEATGGPVDETFARLFPVPPDICEELGATLLFGVVTPTEPVVRDTRSRRSASASAEGDAPYEDSTIRSLLPAWLRPSASTRSIPSDLRGQRFRVRDIGSGDLAELVVQRREGHHWTDFEVPAAWTPLSGAGVSDTQRFIRMLWQVHVQWGAKDATQDSSALRSAIAGIHLTLPDGSTTDALSWIATTARVFVEVDPGAEVTFPATWPAVTNESADAIHAGVKSALSAALRRFTRNEGRYDRPEARYMLKAFARVRSDDPDCPHQLVWTHETGLYRTARWFESGPEDAITPIIELPSLDRAFLQTLRPNITMKVPRSLFNFLQNNSPKDFLDGMAKNDTSGPELQWFCGFNISIIFIIAFMLLITFVYLLNIVFWWIFFFRICIPIPTGLFQSEES